MGSTVYEDVHAHAHIVWPVMTVLGRPQDGRNRPD